MNHQINNDPANVELSIEQLDEVAGGNWLGDAARWVGHKVNAFFTNPVVAGVAGAIIAVGAFVSAGGGASTSLKQN